MVKLKVTKKLQLLLKKPQASRAVGIACKSNPIPIIIPCHRVAGSNKELVGYAYGIGIKRQLLNMEKVNTIFNILLKNYGRINWWENASTFEIMIGAVLAQNTKWENAARALEHLRTELNPKKLINLSPNIIAEKIRTSGFYKRKTESILDLCKWFEKYSFDVRKVKKIKNTFLREELLSIRGIGPETADTILNFAFDKPFFVIDSYTKRVLSRIGVVLPKSYSSLQNAIEKMIPRNAKAYKRYHTVIVAHAKLFCRKTPICSECFLNKICDKKIHEIF